MASNETKDTKTELTIVQGSFQEHEDGVKLLITLAFLLGCDLDISRYLPDRKRPDVMQLNLAYCMLFIGDAKVTESPSNLATQRRLRNYIEWTATHASRAGCISLFAVCFKDHNHTQGWVDTLYRLGLGVGITPVKGEITEISDDFTILWFVFKQINFQYTFMEEA